MLTLCALRTGHSLGPRKRLYHHEALTNELSARFYAAHGLEQSASLSAKRPALLSPLGRRRQGAATRRVIPAPPGRAARGWSRRARSARRIDTWSLQRSSGSRRRFPAKLCWKTHRRAAPHGQSTRRRRRGLLILPRGADCRSKRKRPRPAARSESSSATCQSPALNCRSPSFNMPRVHRRASILNDARLGARSLMTSTFVGARAVHPVPPLIKQGRLIACCTSKTTWRPMCFTPARIAVLNVLASAAAISLENSRLYRELQETRSEDQAAVDANIVGVLISNVEGQIIEANDRLSRDGGI